jgi:hypothetical protein
MPLQITTEPENFSLVQNRLPGSGIPTFWIGKETIDPTVPAGTLATSLVTSDSGSGSGSGGFGPLCKSRNLKIYRIYHAVEFPPFGVESL